MLHWTIRPKPELVVLLITFLFLKIQDPLSQKQVSISSFNTSTKTGASTSSYGWIDILRNLDILVISSTEAAVRYVYGALEFFLIGYLKNIAQLDPSLIGTIVGMQFLLIPIVSPIMGRLSDQIGRKLLIVIGLLVSGLPLLVIPYVISFLPLLTVSLTYGLGFSMVISSTPALVSDFSKKTSYGLAMGFLATIMDVGQMLGPIITGLILATFGYSGSFLSLGLILIAISIFFSFYRKIIPK